VLPHLFSFETGDTQVANAKIQTVIKEMEKAGRLTPRNVVNEARKPKSPLHSWFKQRGAWDDKHAAQKYREILARELIRTFSVTVTTTTLRLRAPQYVRDPHSPPREQGYVAVTRVRNDTDRTREVLVEEFKRAGAAMTRAKSLAAAFNLENDIECVGREIDRLREHVSRGGDERTAEA
jgi:hypothetical protein